MSDTDLFLIAVIPGFTPQIGRLVSMMNYVRSTTLSAVAGLGVSELDYLHDAQSNSIGALLSHIAAANGVSRRDFLNRVAQSLDSDAQRERFLREATVSGG